MDVRTYSELYPEALSEVGLGRLFDTPPVIGTAPAEISIMSVGAYGDIKPETFVEVEFILFSERDFRFVVDDILVYPPSLQISHRHLSPVPSPA